jgi:uncharacterized protein YbbC (DUF1343 family)
MVIEIIKSLYPKEFKEALAAAKGRMEMFNKVNGTDEAYKIITEETHIVWPLRGLHQQERQDFMSIRQKYLIEDYNER